MRTKNFANSPMRGCRKAPLWVLAAIAALFAAGTLPLAAQTTPSTPTPHKSTHPHKRSSAVKPPVPVVQPAPEVVAPVVPKPPDWPANNHPADASVVWDSQGLRIAANNSSLQQILKDVATETGAKVEGFGSDQRIFGEYGPGQPRDVLVQLLEGSGYNVLLVGDQGQGAPRQIVLSVRHEGDGQTVSQNNQPNNSDEDADTDDQQPQPQQPVQMPMRPGFAPGAQPRTPQQIMQEMQQRQQQMQQRNAPQ